jgi:hypothetical protein
MPSMGVDVKLWYHSALVGKLENEERRICILHRVNGNYHIFKAAHDMAIHAMQTAARA